jgi:hypothetical protein
MLNDRAGARGRAGGTAVRLGLLAAAALAAIATLSAALVDDAGAVKTCSRLYEKPPLGDAGPGPAPLLIGDSIVGQSMPELQRLGYRINAQGCRTFPRGVKALKQEGSKRTLPKLVVFALGTGGDVTQAHISKALAVLGPARKLGLVTPRQFMGGEDPDAADYRAAAAANDRIELIDWAQASAAHPEWFTPDLVHPNNRGVKEFVKLMKAVLP